MPAKEKHKKHEAEAVYCPVVVCVVGISSPEHQTTNRNHPEPNSFLKNPPKDGGVSFGLNLPSVSKDTPHPQEKQHEQKMEKQA